MVIAADPNGNRQPPTPAEMQLAAVAEAVRHKDTGCPRGSWLTRPTSAPAQTPARE